MNRLLLLLSLLPVLATQQLRAQGWQWARGATTGAAGSEGYYCTTDAAGSVYSTGVHWSTIHFGSATAAGAGVYLVKHDSVGNVRWVASMNAASSTSVALGVSSDLFGNVYVLGAFNTTMSMGGDTINIPGPSNEYFFLAKVDTAGNAKWLKNIGNLACFQLIQGANFLTNDEGGNLYMTFPFTNNGTIGSYTITNSATDSTKDILVAKFDSSGNVIWVRTFGGKGMEVPYGISVSKKSVYIDGYFAGFDTIAFGGSILVDTGTLGGTSGYIAKLDTDGNAIWAHSIRAHLYAIACNSTDEAFVIGGYGGGAWTLGSTTLPAATGGGDGIVAKYDSSGNVSWAKVIKGSLIIPRGVTVDPCDNAWIISVMGPSHLTTNDTVDGHILPPPTTNGEPNFIAGWTNDGSFITASAMSSGSFDDPNGIAADNCGNIYIVADQEECDTLVIANDTLINNGEGMFVAKYHANLNCGHCDGKAALPNINNNGALMVYPNPATNLLTISAPTDITTLTITNLLGQTVYANHYNSPQVEVDVSALPAGVYLVRVDGTEMRKFIKQ